jgi:hypothetical protein
LPEEENPLRKILFEADSESLWAVGLGNHLYRIDNIPFLTGLVSYNDVVVAEELEDSPPGFLRFVKVHSRGGHSTFRVRVSPDEESTKSAEFLFEFMKDGGCLTERGLDRCVVIDVPPMEREQSDTFWKMLALSADESIWSYSVGYTETKPPWEREV